MFLTEKRKRKQKRGASLRGKIRSFAFVHTKFEVFIGNSNVNVNLVLSLKLKAEV